MIATHVTPHSIPELSKACFDALSKKDLEKIFEDKVKEHLNIEHYFTTSSGRRALYLALETMNLNKGDEVVVPAFTIDLIPMTLRKFGVTSVPVDASLGDYNINPDLIAESISKKTKAIVAVHTFGCPSNLKALKEICEDHHLFLIENAAPAFGAEYAGKPVGTFGDVGILSYGFGKSMSLGCAGGLVFNNEELSKRMKPRDLKTNKSSVKTFFETLASIVLANPLLYGALGYRVKKRRVSTQYDNFDSEILDDAGPSMLSYALGILQIDSKFFEKRRRIALQYSKFLNRADGVETQREEENARSVYSRYFVRVKSKEMRNHCIKRMMELGIEPSVPLAGYPISEGLYPKKYRTRMPNSEELSQTLMGVPVYKNIGEEKLSRIFGAGG
jgi:perosamine synthetase